MNNKEFEKFIKTDKDISKLKELFIIFINSIASNEETYYFYEFLCLRKILIDQLSGELKNLLDENINIFTKEIINPLTQITDEEKGFNKEMIKKFFYKKRRRLLS